MTAQEQMKKILDELMGTTRDGERPDDDIKFTDENVCKSYIMGLCPHALFNNTKMDIGDCVKFHSPALKADYEAASKTRNYGYELDQTDHLKAFIKDCDRKIVLAKKRLAETQDDFDNTDEAQVVHGFEEKIEKKLAEAEVLGVEGKVDESLKAMSEVEDLKSERRKAEDAHRDALPSSSIQQQKLRVCEVCASYLSLYDNDRRLADHFGGKLHMGFIKIRDRLKELEEQVAKKRDEREQERIKRREEREKEVEEKRKAREKERNGERDKKRDRSRERDRDSNRRDGRDRYRDRSRRDRKRSRSRERRRSRSRSRDRRRPQRSPSDSRRASRSRSKSPEKSQSSPDKSRLSPVKSRASPEKPRSSPDKSRSSPDKSLSSPDNLRHPPESEKEEKVANTTMETVL